MGTRIVCAGDCGVDYYLNDRTRWSGGCTLNVAANLYHLLKSGGDSKVAEISVVTALGSDADSHDVYDQIKAIGPYSQVLRLDGSSPTQRIELEDSGERRFRGYDSGVLPAWKLSEGQQRALKDADLVMMPLYTQFEKNFMEIRAAAGDRKLIVDFMDMTDFTATDEIVRDVSRTMHAGFFGLDAGDSAGIEAVKVLSGNGEGMFVVTLGRGGSLVLQNGEIRHRCPAVPVYGAVNTTGAGDAFAAAFIFSMIRYGAVPFALQQASEHAAEVVSGALRVARFLGQEAAGR